MNTQSLTFPLISWQQLLGMIPPIRCCLQSSYVVTPQQCSWNGNKNRQILHHRFNGRPEPWVFTYAFLEIVPGSGYGAVVAVKPNGPQHLLLHSGLYSLTKHVAQNPTDKHHDEYYEQYDEILYNSTATQ